MSILLYHKAVLVAVDEKVFVRVQRWNGFEVRKERVSLIKSANEDGS